MRSKNIVLANRLPLESMRGRDIRLMIIPKKNEGEADEDYKQRLREWNGGTWKQFGKKRIQKGKVVGQEEAWVTEALAEFDAAVDNAEPEWGQMRVRELRDIASSQWAQLESAGAKEKEDDRAAKKRITEILTPDTKRRAREQLQITP